MTLLLGSFACDTVGLVLCLGVAPVLSKELGMLAHADAYRSLHSVFSHFVNNNLQRHTKA